MSQLNDLIALAKELDNAVLMMAALLFGFSMILLLKRKNKKS